ncbi:hypothetical protein [Streptomyces sp. WAC08241]|uniref:hypothetical protein n=1 Tax=Streptomyces sp. WAC08241 TaxID=2487421 RepID=UPI000F76F535|nr:hypothetical protein [Streptomyces sp. WAC08241]RSS43939.1 hypothetical protein EF906_08390 [Streptomyces sp. WAC08241]
MDHAIVVREAGATVFGRFVVPVVFLALPALPLLLARAVFRSGLRKGRERPTAAVPAALTPLAGSVLPFAALRLVLAYAD